MDEIESKEQKPKLCGLAVWSPLLVLFTYLYMLSASFLPNTPFVNGIILLPSLFFLIVSFISGIIACYKINKSQGRLKGNFMAILGMIVAFFTILFMFRA
jgi:p-aminobenzoyl-glutamate transporter AbgT